MENLVWGSAVTWARLLAEGRWPGWVCGGLVCGLMEVAEGCFSLWMAGGSDQHHLGRPSISGQKSCHCPWRGPWGWCPCPEGDYGLGYPGVWLTSCLSTPAPRSLDAEDGHQGAVRARTPGRDPPRRLPASPAQEGDSLGG